MPRHFPFEDVGRNSAGQFVDDDDRLIELLSMILSNKESSRYSGKCIGIIQICFDDNPKAATRAGSYARKPLYSREGANIELIRNGRAALSLCAL
jgi:glutathionylspermidine synthase